MTDVAVVYDASQPVPPLFEARTRDNEVISFREHRDWLDTIVATSPNSTPAVISAESQAVVLDVEYTAWAYQKLESGEITQEHLRKLDAWCQGEITRKVGQTEKGRISEHLSCRPAREVSRALKEDPASLSVGELAVLMRIGHLAGMAKDPRYPLLDAYHRARVVRDYLRELSNPNVGEGLPENVILVGGQMIDVAPAPLPGETPGNALIKSFVRARRAAGANTFVSDDDRWEQVDAIDREAGRRGIPNLAASDLIMVYREMRSISRSGKRREEIGIEVAEVARAAIGRGLEREKIASFIVSNLGFSVVEKPEEELPSPGFSVNLAVPEELPSPERVVDHEHVVYAPEIKVVPDTHGRYPSEYGLASSDENVVGCGDIIDVKVARYSTWNDNNQMIVARNNIERMLMNQGKAPDRDEIERYARALCDQRKIEFEKYQKRLQGEGVRENIMMWCDLMETGRGRMVLGNHELMAMAGILGSDHALYQWLSDDNGGNVTLKALIGDAVQLPMIYIADGTFMPPIDHELCKKVRQAIEASPDAKRFFDLLFSKGKMYVIANEMLVVHAGIAIDKNTGDLIVPERKSGEPLPGLKSPAVGLDALDVIEAAIRRRDTTVIYALAGGSAGAMSPVWMRDPFQKAMSDPEKPERARHVIEQLRIQAQKRGASCKGVILGHTPNTRGARYGEYVFGADNGRGDIVRLRQVAPRGVVAQVPHNFGQDRSVRYTMSRAA